MEEFLEHYKHSSAMERAWLCEVYRGVCDWLYPLVGVSVGVSEEQLAHAVVLRLQRTHPCLPVSYRFVSVAQLMNTQHTPCFSSLTWSTNQHREWIREAEQHLPSHQALSRSNLILIGLLCDGRGSGQCDGFWRVRDASGSVHCEVLSSSPLWLGRLMLFPTWNYISHTAPGRRTDGCLELMDSPLCVTPDLTTLHPGGSLSDVIGVKKAARLLRERDSERNTISVYGKVCVLCPLLVICRKPFFCLILSEEDVTMAVLVTVPECVYWRQCLCLGHSVCISALRMGYLRGWAGFRVLSVTKESRLHPNYQTHRDSEDTSTHLNTQPESNSHTQSQADTHLNTHLQRDTEGEGAQVHDGPVRTKLSKIISYRGRVTGVQDAEAGLYQIDGKMLLCLAYQPLWKWGGGIRPGAELELHNIHFLFRPSPLAPDVVLCACLRSTVTVTGFSALRSKVTPQRIDGPLVCILLEKNLGVSEYLWLCYCHSALTDRLTPRWLCKARVCVVAGRLLQVVLGDKLMKKDKRDIYKEMLQDTHTCPLTQYCVSSPNVSLYSVKELCDWLEKESWACLSLSSLLPSSACHMTQAELNPLLSWSVQTHTLPQTHTLLVGVLELNADGATVRLVDQTGSIDCVCVKSSTLEQCGSIDTAWIGCLVCVRWCTLVTERFMKTDFPSWKHLDRQSYITHKHCRAYICVCVDDLHILSPTTGMSFLIRERETERLKREEEPAGGDGGGEEGGGRDEGRGEKGGGGDGGGVKGARDSGSGEDGGGGEEEGGRDGGGGEEEGGRDGGGGEEEGGRDGGGGEEEGGRDGGGGEEKGGRDGGGGEEEGGRDGGMEIEECVAGPSQTGAGGGAEGWGADSCVSLLFHVHSKQGVAFRNLQSSSQVHTLALSFVVMATRLGDAQLWNKDPRNGRVEERETQGAELYVELQFVNAAVRWFPLLQPGTVYRLLALHTQDVSVLSCSDISVRGRVSFHSNSALLIQPNWRIHTLMPALLLSQLNFQKLMSVSEVLRASSSGVISFYGVISERITLQDKKRGKKPAIQSVISSKDSVMETGLCVRLTLQDVESPHHTLQVYLDFNNSPYTPGLIPGAKIDLHLFQQRVSVVSNVYCASLPISCVTVTGLGAVKPRPPPPRMHLGDWAELQAERSIVAEVRGHVVRVLSLSVQWTCSLCESIFKQDSCTRYYPPCDSTSAVFQGEAKVAVDDGTGKAQVWFSTETLADLLQLDKMQWAGLQRRVRVRGFVRVYTHGRRIVCDVEPDDPLVVYLCHLSFSKNVCRNITLTCKLRSQKTEMPQVRKVCRGNREFITKFPKSLQLQCTHIHTHTHTHTHT